jgi:hypothetical protein
VTTRGSWEEQFAFFEAFAELSDLGRPDSGIFKFGVWDYTRKWQGYTEIDLVDGTSRNVSLSEAIAEFDRELKMGRRAPFLHEYTYRTTGWEWDFGRLSDDQSTDQSPAFSETIGGLLNHFLAASVESKAEDMFVDFDAQQHVLRVLDSTPGGNGLSEALLKEGRTASAFNRCCKEIKKYTGRGKKRKFRKYMTALRLDAGVSSPEELYDVIHQLHLRWTR